MAQIEANPGNFFFVVTTTDFPNGAIIGTLSPDNDRFFTGGLMGSNVTGGGSANGSGAFTFTLSPNPGGQTNTLKFDIATAGLGNSFTGFTIVGPASMNFTPITFGTNAVAVNGRVTGTAQINATAAAAIMQNPTAFSVVASTPGSNVTTGAGSPALITQRTNIDFFNPNDNTVTIVLEIRDQTGAVLGTRTITLQADQMIQMPLIGASGVFNNITTDVANVSVLFLASSPILVDASVIDNTSGDAMFVTPEDVSQENTTSNQ